MLLPDRYSFIPPLHKRHIPLVVLWIVVIVVIALISTRGASASPGVFGSPLQSPLPTPTPQPLIVSFSPAAGSRDVPRHTPLTVTFRLDLDNRAIEQGLTIDPPISGTIKWQGRTLVFAPELGWQPDQMYRITVKYRGQILPCCARWNFTTLVHALSDATVGGIDHHPRTTEVIADDTVSMSVLDHIVGHVCVYGVDKTADNVIGAVQFRYGFQSALIQKTLDQRAV